MATVIERYPAVVTVNEDPDKLGRIKVKCAGILGDEEAELPMWVLPCLDWGMFTIPDIDEQVEVEMVVHNTTDEVRGQSSLEAPDLRWRGKRFYAPEAETPTVIHEDFTAKNYAKRRGFATPMGHVFYFDDTEGETEITLGWVDKDGKKSRLQFDKDGTFTVTVLDEKHMLQVKHDGEFHAHLNEGKQQINMLDADKVFNVKLDEESHTLTLDATAKKLEASLDGGTHTLTVDASAKKMEASLDSGAASLTIDASGTEAKVQVGSDQHSITLNASGCNIQIGGDTSKHVAIVEELQSLYEELKGKLDSFDSHTHSVPAAGLVCAAPGSPVTGSATSATPSPTISAPSWNSAINSSKVSIPAG